MGWEMTTNQVDNTQDLLDSRDVIARIAELEEQESRSEDDQAELDALNALANDADCSPDWEYGETLIRDSYFTEYAQDLAEDIGAIGRDVQWPLMYIDWDAAAESLKMDYMSVEFDGVDYWIRA